MRVVGTAVIARVHLLKFMFSIDLSNFYSYNHVIIRVWIIKIVIVINCNLITFSKVIACNCN